MKKELERKFNEGMGEDVKSGAGYKATLVVFLMYVAFFVSFAVNPKLTIAITFLASTLVFMIVSTVIVWLGTRKHFEEQKYKKKIRKLKKLHKKGKKIQDI